ncbi:LON peptidase substrate-binding domain-containing protein [Candidatus Kapabacteria bacterium]|nr:LON peptidase substrate-binding domain-containing protein [Candidatus Kapabacteria bacterium]
MVKLGLFPLNLVLFPEAIYPLHIFEDRYKKLINTSIDNGEEFGINLVTSSKMYDFGCTAKVHQVTKRYADGKIDLNVIGVRRYSLIGFSEHEMPYYTGEIEFFSDRDELLDEPGLIDVINLFNELASTIKLVNIKRLKLEDLETKYPSFFIAQKSGLSPIQKQELLEMKSENNRLSFLRRHLKNILPALNEAQQIEKVVQNDGYLSPNQFNS